MAYQEHRGVQAIRRGLTQDLVGGVKVIVAPVVLYGELLETLALGEGTLDAFGSAEGVVLRLVEDLVVLHQGQEAVLPLQGLAGV